MTKTQSAIFGLICLGLFGFGAWVAAMQFRLPKGQPIKVQGEVVAFDVRESSSRFPPLLWANVRLPDGGLIAVQMPNLRSNCKVGDLIVLNKFKNRYTAAIADCRSRSTAVS